MKNDHVFPDAVRPKIFSQAFFPRMDNFRFDKVKCVTLVVANQFAVKKNLTWCNQSSS